MKFLEGHTSKETALFYDKKRFYPSSTTAGAGVNFFSQDKLAFVKFYFFPAKIKNLESWSLILHNEKKNWATWVCLTTIFVGRWGFNQFRGMGLCFYSRKIMYRPVKVGIMVSQNKTWEYLKRLVIREQDGEGMPLLPPLRFFRNYWWYVVDT